MATDPPPDWMPVTCPAGHDLQTGRLNRHWSNHPGCPVNRGPDGDGRGHTVFSCETELCGAELRQPECTNPEPIRAPRSHRQRP